MASRLTSNVSILRAYLRDFVHFAGRRIWGGLALVVATSLLSGGGVMTLLPLLQVVGLEGGGETTHGWARVIADGLWACGIPFSLPAILVLLVVLVVAQALLRAWMTRYQTALDTDFSAYLHERFYAALMQARWSFFLRQRTSDISQILAGEMQHIAAGTRQMLMLFGQSGICVIDVAVATIIAPKLTVGVLVLGGLVTWGMRPIWRRMLGQGQGHQRDRAALAANVSEFLAGLKVAKSHGRERVHYERYRQTVVRLGRQMVAASGYHARRRALAEIGAAVALCVVLYLALAVFRLPLAELLVLGYVFMRLFNRANSLQIYVQGIVQALPSFVAMETQREALLVAAEEARCAPVQRLTLQRGLRLDAVSFCYPASATPALCELSLDLPARRATAICGQSGAGKSTLADLLLGLLTPTSGQILIDGEPLCGDRLHDWRPSIGYVPQETFLFHDTVRANLQWAAPEAGEVELRAALRAAAAEAFVDQLPQGLDTMLGDRGIRLSGGERQRLALARALLCRPTLLILDEATSALDAQNEKLIQEAIERLQGDITLVIIAHRLSTVRQADQIVVLDHGRLAERGSWTELIAMDGAFRRLVAAQTAPLPA